MQAGEPKRYPRPASTGPDGAGPPSTLAVAPQPVAAIEVARARLARELRSLPPWGSAALMDRLLASPTAATPGSPASASASSGALVHFIRLAQRVGATQVAAELFVALLGRCEGLCGQWARRTVASAPVDRALVSGVREDLRQELTLRLWERVGRGNGEPWELFFQRALVFEQRHVAKAFMMRNGYWRDPLSQSPSRGLTILLSRLIDTPAGKRATDLPTLIGGAASHPTQIADGSDHFTAADLSDLRRLVEGLPDRERQAVTLRFWYGASEAEIGAALAGVTTRTVRNILSRAYARLRGDYQPDSQSDAENTAWAGEEETR